MGDGFTKLTTSFLLAAMLIAPPANARIVLVDELVCPSYDKNNTGPFFDRDEIYLSGTVIDAQTYGLVNKKHPKDIAIQKTNASEGLFYQLYKIKPLIVVKSDREIEPDVPITVLDLSLCGECDLKPIRRRRSTREEEHLPALYKLIPAQELDGKPAIEERARSFLPVLYLKIFKAVISSFKAKGVTIDYILADPCNLYRVDASGSSDVIESYQELMK